MNLLDTDTLTLLMQGHATIAERLTQTPDTGITMVSWIEVLQGRFASVLKAADGAQLLRAQHRLRENEKYLRSLMIVDFDGLAVAEFENLREDKKLKKIGRADLLIACIALAHKGTLVTRNLRHFRQVPGLKVENWAD